MDYLKMHTSNKSKQNITLRFLTQNCKMAARTSILPIVSKLFCSAYEAIFVVRSRPQVVNGGGFVVLEPGSQKVIFRVDGCGVLGKKEELILQDADGNPLLLMRRKGGIVEALSISRRWNGYTYELDGSQQLVFCLKQARNSCLRDSAIRISIQSRKSSSYEDFEIKGYFPDRECSIVELSSGNVVAQVGAKEVKQVKASRDVYHVTIKPAIDQAFVFGVIAVLDYIYYGTTRC